MGTAIDFNLEDSIELLRKTPHVLHLLLSGLPDEWIHNNEGGDSWSPYSICGHLLYGEQTDWIIRCKIILDSGVGRTFDEFDRTAQFEKFKGWSISRILDEFEIKRAENLHELTTWDLSPKDLKLKGLHPDLGEVTMAQLLATWTAHDLAHINQITRVMAKQYTNETGPWKSYFKLLNN